MRTAQTLKISFSGQVLETVSLYRDSAVLQKNLEALRRLLHAGGVLGRHSLEAFAGDGHNGLKRGFLLRNIPSKTVIEFLQEYQTHPAAYRVNSEILADFIASINKEKELTDWTVAVKGTQDGQPFELFPEIVIGMNRRAANPSLGAERYSIGRLLDPADEAIDLSEQEWQAALELTQATWKSDPGRMHLQIEPQSPNGPSIRHIRGIGGEEITGHPERGLLVLYLSVRQLGFPDFMENGSFGRHFSGR